MNKGILETRKVNNSRVRGREMGLMNFVGIFESRRCTARCTARCGLGIVNNNPPSHSRRRALSTNSTSISRFRLHHRLPTLHNSPTNNGARKQQDEFERAPIDRGAQQDEVGAAPNNPGLGRGAGQDCDGREGIWSISYIQYRANPSNKETKNVLAKIKSKDQLEECLSYLIDCMNSRPTADS